MGDVGWLAIPWRIIGACPCSYDVAAYRRAIGRSCDLAFPLPDDLARRQVPARGRKKNALWWETDAEWRKRLGPEQW